jgi:hypothetical protein
MNVSPSDQKPIPDDEQEMPRDSLANCDFPDESHLRSQGDLQMPETDRVRPICSYSFFGATSMNYYEASGKEMGGILYF